MRLKEMSTSKMIRPLGSIEKFVDCCTVSRNLNMAVAVTVKTKSKITFDILERALINLQAEHLQLQVCLKRQQEIAEKKWSLNPFKWFKSPKPVTKPEFWSVADTMLRIPIQIVTVKNSDWMTFLEDVLQVNFEEGKLLWRAYWVEKTDANDNRGTLILNVHPSLSDSKGLFLLANDALGHIDQILKNDQPDRIVAPKLHLNVEETVDIGSGMSFMEKLVMFKNMILFAIPWKSTYMRTHPAPLVPDYKTGLIQIAVSVEWSKKILKAVETRGVSLHAVWTAAAGIAMHQMLNLTAKSKFRSTHEVDLRVLTRDYDSKECRIHGTFCNYAEVTMETNRVKSTEEFWNFATLVHETISENIHSDKLIKMMKYCSQFGDMYSMFATLGSTRSVRNDYAVAVHDNVDLFIDDRDTIEIENLCSSVASHNMGSPFHHTVHVFRGKIFYYIFHFANYSTADKTKEFANNTLEVLKLYSE